MTTLVVVLALASTLATGLSAGALLAEACVLVPMWRRQESAAFLSWYGAHAALLLRFFGPLEVVAAATSAVAAALAVGIGAAGGVLACLAATGNVLVLASFPLYFRNANARFASGDMSAEDVRRSLAAWSAWHWGRTAVAILAFSLSVCGPR